MGKRKAYFWGLMLIISAILAVLGRENETVDPGGVVLRASDAQRRILHDGASDFSKSSALELPGPSRGNLSPLGHNPFGTKTWQIQDELLPAQTATSNAALVVDVPDTSFKYLGRIQEEGGQTVVFLTQGPRMYNASAGQAIDNEYKLDSVSENKLVLDYLPLKSKRMIEIENVSDTDPGADESYPAEPSRPAAFSAPVSGNSLNPQTGSIP